jgi:large subunit ribosomal protein L9
MEVILLTDVDKVGLKGDVVNVARGYARNFLLPRRLAEEATGARVAELQKREAQRARQEAQTFDQARELADVLAQTVLRFDVKAGPTGSLFGSVTPTDIVEELWTQKKIRVDRRKVVTDPIKRIGRHAVPIELFQDVTVEVQTHVVPKGGELPPDEELEAMEAAERAEQEAAADAEAELVFEEEAEPEAQPPVRASGPVEGAPGEEAEPPVRASGPVEGVAGEPGGSSGGEPSDT